MIPHLLATSAIFSALDRLSGPDVDPESAHDPPEVDAAVLPEALVFFSDHGVEQVRRHLR